MAKDYHISKAFLYGSYPPPNDTVWKAAREKNYEVKTFKRSGSGREKEVDTAMTADMMKYLYKRSTDKVVFIVVTGDKDFKPPIRHILEEELPVELWSWKDSMANDYEDLAKHNSLFTATKLDDVQDEFSYTAYMSTRKKTNINSDHAIVYLDVPKGKSYIEKIIGHINQLFRIFYYTSIDKGVAQDVIVEFPQSELNDICQELDKLKLEYQFSSHSEYTQQAQRHPPTQTNCFKALGEELDDDLPLEAFTSLGIDITRSNPLAEREDEVRNDDTWASKAEMTARMKKQKKTRCRWGEHCVQASNCLYSHTEEEKSLFSRFPNSEFKYYRIKRCNKEHKTPEQKKNCTYAHDSEESWCLKCSMYGHLTDDCPQK